VKQNVIEPLSDFLKRSSLSDNLSPKFIQDVKTISGSVDTWVKENKGKRWYITIESKEYEVERLSNTLDVKLNSVSSEIDLEKPKLNSRQKLLEEKVKKLKDNPVLKEKKDSLNKFQAKMDKILPEWIRGLISVEQMVQIFPFVVVILTIFALNASLAAASHYRFLTQELNLSKVTITDPSFSSLWALAYRGKLGTILTVGVHDFYNSYVVFL